MRGGPPRADVPGAAQIVTGFWQQPKLGGGVQLSTGVYTKASQAILVGPSTRSTRPCHMPAHGLPVQSLPLSAVNYSCQAQHHECVLRSLYAVFPVEPCHCELHPPAPTTPGVGEGGGAHGGQGHTHPACSPCTASVGSSPETCMLTYVASGAGPWDAAPCKRAQLCSSMQVTVDAVSSVNDTRLDGIGSNARTSSMLESRCARPMWASCCATCSGQTSLPVLACRHAEP